MKGRCPGPLDERDSLRHGTSNRAGGGVADPPAPVKRSCRRHTAPKPPTGAGSTGIPTGPGAVLQAGGNRRFCWNTLNHLRNISSVSITSWKPAWAILMVETMAGGPGSVWPYRIW